MVEWLAGSRDDDGVDSTESSVSKVLGHDLINTQRDLLNQFVLRVGCRFVCL